MDTIEVSQVIKEVEYSITKLLVDEVQQGKLSDTESREIASYILENIPSLQSTQDVVLFLQDLSQKWPLFSPVYAKIHGRVTEVEETARTIEKVKEELAAMPNNHG